MTANFTKLFKEISKNQGDKFVNITILYTQEQLMDMKKINRNYIRHFSIKNIKDIWLIKNWLRAKINVKFLWKNNWVESCKNKFFS